MRQCQRLWKKKQVLVGQFDIGGSGSQVLDGGVS